MDSVRKTVNRVINCYTGLYGGVQCGRHLFCFAGSARRAIVSETRWPTVNARRRATYDGVGRNGGKTSPE